jgi:hypothetical protein
MATWTQLVWQQAAVALLNGEQNLRTFFITFHSLTNLVNIVGTQTVLLHSSVFSVDNYRSIFTKINLIGKIKETSFFKGTAGCSIPENTMDMNCSQTGCIIYTLNTFYFSEEILIFKLKTMSLHINVFLRGSSCYYMQHFHLVDCFFLSTRTTNKGGNDIKIISYIGMYTIYNCKPLKASLMRPKFISLQLFFCHCLNFLL